MKVHSNYFDALQKTKPTKAEELKELKKECDLFESEILKFYLKDAMDTKNTLFPKSEGSEIYQSMYEQALSDKLSGNFGYSKLLFDFLKNRI